MKPCPAPGRTWGTGHQPLRVSHPPPSTPPKPQVFRYARHTTPPPSSTPDLPSTPRGERLPRPALRRPAAPPEHISGLESPAPCQTLSGRRSAQWHPRLSHFTGGAPSIPTPLPVGSPAGRPLSLRIFSGALNRLYPQLRWTPRPKTVYCAGFINATNLPLPLPRTVVFCSSIRSSPRLIAQLPREQLPGQIHLIGRLRSNFSVLVGAPARPLRPVSRSAGAALPSKLPSPVFVMDPARNANVAHF